MPSLASRRVLFLLFASAFSICSLLAQTRPTSGEAALIEAEHEVSARMRSGWKPAVPILPLSVGDAVRTGERSRAAVRLTDRSVFRMDELTSVEILPPEKLSKNEGLDFKRGAAFLFSRDKPREMRIQTPVATGALRGTEFHIRVADDGKTTLTMLDGEVELSNERGSIIIRSGEQGEVVRGQAPRKTAAINAINIIQWCLYYPAVLNPAELGIRPSERSIVSDSLAAYSAGDLLGALEKYPEGYRASSPAGRLYHAAVLLAVGRVDRAEQELAGVPPGDPGRAAVEQMLAAVKFQNWSGYDQPTTAGEWLAKSYYLQSKARLEEARSAARRATEMAPEFGYAWVRLAELEFSLGRTPQALQNLERGVGFTPRNAQAYSLKGFLLSAENKVGLAREQFEHAMQLDGALGNAWLGRGLTFIRQRKDELGRQDLQVAAVLEPNRAIFHSYLGKAFSQIGDVAVANRELKRAKGIDPNDPTPWLYSAIEKKQENRYNEAIDDLEKSIELNDNRRVYRSRFLLDQDESIRGTNLAAIYLDDGMREQSFREAVRAVDDDYSSAPAHLFLANSYNALRDPDRVLLRYETPWFNELLVSNLLSPVGGGPLSQFVSEQEYSKMFQRDGFGINSVTDYFSYGEWRETASQYGTFGNVSYAFDTEYQYNDGLRPNNLIERSETYGEAKLQLGPQDTLFFQTKFEDLTTGDVRQYYNQSSANTTLHAHETEDPALLLLGWHHAWSPGNDMLILIGRLASDQTFTFRAPSRLIFRDISNLLPAVAATTLQPDANPADTSENSTGIGNLVGRGRITGIEFPGVTPSFPTFHFDYGGTLEIYSGEVQQIITLGPNTVIGGLRCQRGQFDTGDLLTTKDPAFDVLAANQTFTVDFERVNLYLYDTWRVAKWLSVTGGLTFDYLQYPDNFRAPPVNGSGRSFNKLSPKIGFIVQPLPGTIIRSAYSEAISGASFDESVRLEPTQISGFTQAFRSLASESVLGEVAGSKFRFFGVSAEQKLRTPTCWGNARTYVGVEFDILKQNVDQTLGVFDSLQSQNQFPTENLPSSIEAKDSYREDIVTATVNELIGDDWSFGARYRYTSSKFREILPALLTASPINADDAAALAAAADNHQQARLHELNLYAIYNHPSGFFAEAGVNWYKQINEQFAGPRANEPGDDFWQLNLIVGYRFYRNQCEISCGVLNLTDQDYQLNPLNPYLELPRSRTFALRAKLSF